MKNQNQRGFFGIVISKEILNDRELTINEKFIYSYLASFQKYCFESNERIANKLGVSESSVRHTIPALTKKGYIVVEKVNNSNNKRRIYDVFNKPKKKLVLERKFNNSACGKLIKNDQPVVQNLHDVVQNLHYTITGVRSAKFAHIE